MSIVFVVSSFVLMAYLPFGSASKSVGTRGSVEKVGVEPHPKRVGPAS